MALKRTNNKFYKVNLVINTEHNTRQMIRNYIKLKTILPYKKKNYKCECKAVFKDGRTANGHRKVSGHRTYFEYI